MTAAELQAYLLSHIPLTAAIEAHVVKADSAGVVLEAPLAPNINHAGTAFGGSIASLATLAGWSVMRLLTDVLPSTPRLVIRRSQVEYLAPISGAFTAHSTMPSAEEISQFLDLLARKGKARLHLEATVMADGIVAATLKADFVALIL